MPRVKAGGWGDIAGPGGTVHSWSHHQAPATHQTLLEPTCCVYRPPLSATVTRLLWDKCQMLEVWTGHD